MRNRRLSRVPVSASFHKRLLLLNNLDSLGFEEWVFHPAMLFGSLYKWWGALDKRQRPHEGLDLALYRITDGSIHHLGAGAKIPVIFKGQVVRVSSDFLGKSVFVRHDAYHSDGSRLYTIYGHIEPEKRVRPGEKLSKGDIIGVVADRAGNSRAVIPSHLHVSVSWISNTMPVSELRWQALSQNAMVVFLDPLTVIGWPYSIVSTWELTP